MSEWTRSWRRQGGRDRGRGGAIARLVVAGVLLGPVSHRHRSGSPRPPAALEAHPVAGPAAGDRPPSGPGESAETREPPAGARCSWRAHRPPLVGAEVLAPSRAPRSAALRAASAGTHGRELGGIAGCTGCPRRHARRGLRGPPARLGHRLARGAAPPPAREPAGRQPLCGSKGPARRLPARTRS
jgi:hypothetical protein